MLYLNEIDDCKIRYNIFNRIDSLYWGYGIYGELVTNLEVKGNEFVNINKYGIYLT